MSDVERVQIRARMHERLLAELPRMFNGALGILRETLQNARRAGAGVVRFNLEANQLEISDDGRGCDDPAVLLIGGESHWSNAQQIVEPAGLGIFSLFDADIVERVRFQSRTWRLEAEVSAILAGEFIAVETQTDAIRGFQIGLTLRPEALNPARVKIALEQLAAWIGVEVLLNGERIIPTNRPRHTLTISSPAGEMRLAGRNGLLTVIWEGLPIGAHHARAAIERAATRLEGRYPHLAHAVAATEAVWVVDGVGGVRPTLPDRSELRVDGALETAAERLVELACERATELLRAITLPDRIALHTFRDPVPIELMHLFTPTLECLGWQRCLVQGYRALEASFDEYNGLAVEPNIETVFDRQALAVKDDATATTLNALCQIEHATQYAYPSSSATATTAEVFGEIPPSTPSKIRLAHSIRLGTLELPILFHTTDDDGHALTIATGHEGLGKGLRLLEAGDALSETIIGYALYHESCTGDVHEREWVVDSSRIEHGTLRRALRRELVEAYGGTGEITQVTRRLHLEEGLEQLKDLRHRIPSSTLDGRLDALYLDILLAVNACINHLERELATGNGFSGVEPRTGEAKDDTDHAEPRER